MKVTVEWLREYVETDADADEIGAVLTMLGLELEGVEDSPSGPILDFKVTPNRGDCLSVLGIARELCAKDVARFAPTGLMARFASEIGSGSPDPLVTIENPDLCSRYAAQIFSGIAIGPSSEKVAQRVTAAGMRPINVLVDTTNYVMLELGQPLHAFDLDKLAGRRIVVRAAKPGEKIRTLDGIERALQPEMLMICDAERPVAIAGVMGGEDSEVGPDTKNLLLESAHFDPVSVRKTRRTLGMSTEASYRFERYVDPEGVVRAVNRFAELLDEQTRVTEAAAVIDVYPRKPSVNTIAVRENRWNRLLGMDVPVAAAATGLQALGCRVSEGAGKLEVVPPSWRNDLALEEDLVEEIGRLWGYENIPEALPSGSTPQGGESASAALRSRIHRAMLRLGFSEVVTHTLRDRSALDPALEPVSLRNPAAPELSILRPSLLPGLAEAARKNRGRSLALFETGRVFATDEARAVAFLMSGQLWPDHWSDHNIPESDFFAAKGVVEELLELAGRSVAFEASDDPRFHPTKQARVMCDGKTLGLLGEINPAIVESIDLAEGTLMAQLDIDAVEMIPESASPYRPLSAFPLIRRDIAVVVDKSVQYVEIESRIKAAASGILEEIRLFDVYEGKGIDTGKHSLAIAIVLRHPERTLTDEEANLVRAKALESLRELGAMPR